MPQPGRIKKIKAKVKLEEDNYGWQNNFNVFTIVSNNLEIKDIVSFEPVIHGNPVPDEIEFRFDRDPTNAPVSEGDIINIRTDCDIEVLKSGSHGTYLVTILLELDPL